MDTDLPFVARGYRNAVDAGDGGGAEWENELDVVLAEDELRLIETQTVHPQFQRTIAYELADIGDVKLATSFLKIRMRRRRLIDHLVRWLDDPPKIRFHQEQSSAFREMVSRLVQRIG